MNALISLVDHPTAGLLASSLVHFLWQGALLGIMTGWVLTILEKSKASVRYAVAAGALFLMAIAVWQVTGDGEAAAFEGLALIGLYAILAVITFYE